MDTKNIDRLKFWYKIAKYVSVFLLIDLFSPSLGKYIFGEELGIISGTLIAIIVIIFGNLEHGAAEKVGSIFTIVFLVPLVPALISWDVLRRKIIKLEKASGITRGLQEAESVSPLAQRIYKILGLIVVALLIAGVLITIFE